MKTLLNHPKHSFPSLKNRDNNSTIVKKKKNKVAPDTLLSFPGYPYVGLLSKKCWKSQHRVPAFTATDTPLYWD